MEKEQIKKVVKDNIETFQNILDTTIRPEFKEVKDMLLNQLNTLNDNISKDLDKLEE